METVTAVLYKLKLILGAYCVGVQWLLAHSVHRNVQKPQHTLALNLDTKCQNRRTINLCIMYLLTFHKLIWSDEGSTSSSPVSSFGHKLPSPLSWNPTAVCIRYKSTYSTCRAVSDSFKNFSTDSARFPIGGSWKWKLPFIKHTKHYSPYDITVWCFGKNVWYAHYPQCFYYCTELITIWLVI